LAIFCLVHDFPANSVAGISRRRRAFHLLPGGEGRDEGGRKTIFMLNSLKNEVFTRTERKMAAQMDFRPHGRKAGPHGKPIARTDRSFAARRGKWPHGTIFVRTVPAMARTNRL
jgi:hypothetical protein